MQEDIAIVVLISKDDFRQNKARFDISENTVEYYLLLFPIYFCQGARRNRILGGNMSILLAGMVYLTHMSIWASIVSSVVVLECPWLSSLLGYRALVHCIGHPCSLVSSGSSLVVSISFFPQWPDNLCWLTSHLQPALSALCVGDYVLCRSKNCAMIRSVIVSAATPGEWALLSWLFCGQIFPIGFGLLLWILL